MNWTNIARFSKKEIYFLIFFKKKFALLLVKVNAQEKKKRCAFSLTSIIQKKIFRIAEISLQKYHYAWMLEKFMEVNKTKRQNSPTLKNSQKFVKWGQWFNTRSNSEKVINFEITDFSMYGDFLPKIDASFS